jgi:hypothetical protein
MKKTKNPWVETDCFFVILYLTYWFLICVGNRMMHGCTKPYRRIISSKINKTKKKIMKKGRINQA